MNLTAVNQPNPFVATNNSPAKQATASQQAGGANGLSQDQINKIVEAISKVLGNATPQQQKVGQDFLTDLLANAGQGGPGTNALNNFARQTAPANTAGGFGGTDNTPVGGNVGGVGGGTTPATAALGQAQGREAIAQQLQGLSEEELNSALANTQKVHEAEIAAKDAEAETQANKIITALADAIRNAAYDRGKNIRL